MKIEDKEVIRQKLLLGDIYKVARELQCSPKSVEFTLNGKRGKRTTPTPLQRSILEACALVAHQNDTLQRFCQTRKQTRITLQKS